MKLLYFSLPPLDRTGLSDRLDWATRRIGFGPCSRRWSHSVVREFCQLVGLLRVSASRSSCHKRRLEAELAELGFSRIRIIAILSCTQR